MLKTFFAVIILVSAGLAQTSSDGSFSVRHSKLENFSLSPEQMRQAENLYKSACAVVQHDFHLDGRASHLHFTVVVGEEGNTLHTWDEIWMKKWDPDLFVQAVVLLELQHFNVFKELSDRAVRYSHATTNVAEFK